MSDLTPQQQRDAQAAMAEKFQSDEVQSSLQLDIDNFTRTVKEITAAFDVVNRKLGEIDNLGLDSKKFQPTWAGYQKRYRALLWDSKDLATKIATQSEQFATAMLPIATGEADPSLTKKQRAEQFKFFIQLNESQGREANEMNKKFSDLADEITAFKSTFSSFADEKLKDANKQIKELEAELAGLKQELDSINKKIIALVVGLGLIIFATVALCIVFPAATAQIAAAGVSAATGAVGVLGKAYDDRSKIVSSIATKSQKVKDLTNTVQQIEKARADLQNLANNEIATIIGGLQMLSDIWRNVDSDCRAVEQYLRNADEANDNIGEDPKAPAALAAYAKKGVSIYLGLTKALKLYASGINNAAQG